MQRVREARRNHKKRVTYRVDLTIADFSNSKRDERIKAAVKEAGGVVVKLSFRINPEKGCHFFVRVEFPRVQLLHGIVARVERVPDLVVVCVSHPKAMPTRKG